MATFNASNDKQLADVSALVAYTITPVSNDQIQLANGDRFTWIENSTKTADGVYIVEQTSASALGKWHKSITAKGILTYSITLEDCPSGEVSQKNDYPAVGLLTTNFNVVSYDAPSTAGLIISSVAQSGAGLLGVNFENQSGATLTGVVLNVKVLVI